MVYGRGRVGDIILDPVLRSAKRYFGRGFGDVMLVRGTGSRRSKRYRGRNVISVLRAGVPQEHALGVVADEGPAGLPGQLACVGGAIMFAGTQVQRQALVIILERRDGRPVDDGQAGVVIARAAVGVRALLAGGAGDVVRRRLQHERLVPEGAGLPGLGLLVPAVDI